jgi:hypothetical protein
MGIFTKDHITDQSPYIVHYKYFQFHTINDILWAQTYDNNTLLLAAIRYKKTRKNGKENAGL